MIWFVINAYSNLELPSLEIKTFYRFAFPLKIRSCIRFSNFCLDDDIYLFFYTFYLEKKNHVLIISNFPVCRFDVENRCTDVMESQIYLLLCAEHFG